jgi:hypothetical protein
MERIELQKNEKGFYFFELRSGAHDHIKTRVWVNRALVKVREEKFPNYGGASCLFEAQEKGTLTHDVKRVEEVSFPIRGAQVVRTEKGALVLRPSEEGWVALIRERSGYRGSASFSLEGDYEIVAEGQEYHSPRGNLGETAWALVNVRGPELVVHAKISGRRVSREEYSYRVFPDGRTENLEEEGLEQLLE